MSGQREYDLAIDFGTTASAAAVRFDDEEPRLMEFESGSNSVPSAVFRRVGADSGPAERILLGHEAVERIRSGSVASGEGEATPKRLIRHHEDTHRLAGTHLPVTTIVSWVLAGIYREVRQQLDGQHARSTTLTYPAAWGEMRRRALTTAAEAASLPNLQTLISEPEAAARHVAFGAPEGQKVAIYDLGGGTCDIAVLQHDGHETFSLVARGTGELEVGGEALDVALLEAALAALRQSRNSAAEAAQVLSAIRDDPSWNGGGDMAPSEVVQWRSCASTLAIQIKRAREALTLTPEADVVLHHPAPDWLYLLTRAQFEKLADPILEGSFNALHDAIHDAGGADVVHLVGGASVTPLVRASIAKRTGLPTTMARQPKGAVALGALRAVHEREIREQIRQAEAAQAELHRHRTASARRAASRRKILDSDISTKAAREAVAGIIDDNEVVSFPIACDTPGVPFWWTEFGLLVLTDSRAIWCRSSGRDLGRIVGRTVVSSQIIEYIASFEVDITTRGSTFKFGNLTKSEARTLKKWCDGWSVPQ